MDEPVFDPEYPSRSGGSPRPATPVVFILALWWCLWLLGSWSVTLLIDSVVPAVRWMVYAALTGLLLLWPAWRLSLGQAEDAGEGKRMVLARVLRDWLMLMLVFQAVVWALPLTSGWGLGQTLWLDAAVAAWSLLTGAVVAWGALCSGPGMRAAAMGLCVLLVLGEPAARAGAVWAGLGAWSGPMRISPLSAVQGLTAPPAMYEAGRWGWQVMAVGTAAVLAWTALALGPWGRRGQDQ